METQTYIGTLVAVTCKEKGCGVVFGLDREYQDALRKSHNTFYCPNGHRRYYPGETEEEKLRKALKGMEDSRNYHREVAEQTALSNRSLRGVVTRTKRRIGHGVCPCCTRTFTKLAAHIKAKHPDYVKEKE